MALAINRTPKAFRSFGWEGGMIPMPPGLDCKNPAYEEISFFGVPLFGIPPAKDPQDIPYPFKLLKSSILRSAAQHKYMFESQGDIDAAAAGIVDREHQIFGTVRYEPLLTLLGLTGLELRQSFNAGAEAEEPVSRFLTEARRLAELGEGLSGCTTVVIKNIPHGRTQLEFLHMLNSLGLSGKFDFLHKPGNLRRRSCNCGFAFLNFTSPDIAAAFYTRYNGCFFEPGATTPLLILPANVQGLHNNSLQFLVKGRLKSFAEEPFILANTDLFAQLREERFTWQL